MIYNRILIVDDEINIRKTISAILTDEGFTVFEADCGKNAMEVLKNNEIDLMITDVWMEDIDGLQLIDFVKENKIDIEIIVISGHATIEIAVNATKKGAIDFIEKPLSFDKLLLSIANALKHRELKLQNKWLIEQVSPDSKLIGKSFAFSKLLQDIDLAAPSDGRVFIYGENGSGKEVVARTIHTKSNRSGKPLVDVNCAAIPDELIESELFGHVKGSFTGALENKKGKFLVADGGTLFLDEIGDMSLKTQAKVLRVLQENAITPVGGTKTINVNVRVISATNKNLTDEIEKGNFRQDLYYRLNVIELYVPPLRERIEDLPALVDYFLNKYAVERKVEKKSISEDSLAVLMEYNWPGNIRELQNLIERIMIMAKENLVTLNDIPFPINKNKLDFLEKEILGLKESRELFEKNHIEKVIREAGYNMTKAAELLKIERSYLYQKTKHYGIDISNRRT